MVVKLGSSLGDSLGSVLKLKGGILYCISIFLRGGIRLFIGLSEYSLV